MVGPSLRGSGLSLIPAKVHNVPIDFDGILAMLRKRGGKKLRKVLLDEGEPQKPNVLRRLCQSGKLTDGTSRNSPATAAGYKCRF